MSSLRDASSREAYPSSFNPRLQALIGAWGAQVAKTILRGMCRMPRVSLRGLWYMIRDEIVPESRRMGYGCWATVGIMLGVTAGLCLNVSLG